MYYVAPQRWRSLTKAGLGVRHFSYGGIIQQLKPDICGSSVAQRPAFFHEFYRVFASLIWDLKRMQLHEANRDQPSRDKKETAKHLVFYLAS
jgi:hypothetical protein